MWDAVLASEGHRTLRVCDPGKQLTRKKDL